MKNPSGPIKSIDCACGLILERGRILLGLRAPDNKIYPDVWDLFGGHVEDKESIEEALVRELREELDITPKTFEFLTTLLEADPPNNGKCLYHIYKITEWAGPGPRLRGAEHTEMRWHTLDEAVSSNLAVPEYRTLFSDHVVL